MSTDTKSKAPVILGNYQLVKRLGEGAMAKVFLARHTGTGEQVALKVMRRPDNDSEWEMRFRQESDILLKLRHPSIVRVTEAGTDRGLHYIAMEYLDHGDLTRWIREGLQPPDALRILRALADALDCAHRHGYIHRDVKPDNVLFRADATPVLTDFGVARPRARDSKLTQTGLAIGTPRYMSPEQHKGMEVTPSTDLYALGIIFHEMLTKQVPYDGPDGMTIGMRHLQDPLPRLPPQFARFQRFLDTLLAKTPAERFNKGESVVQAIDLLLAAPDPAAKRAIAATAVLQRGLDVKETETKTGMFSKACDIEVAIGAEDNDALQARWQKAVVSLREWHQEVGKKARHIAIDFYVHPWILVRVKEFVKRLAAADDYAFLNERKARIRVHNLDGALEAEWVLGEAPAA